MLLAVSVTNKKKKGNARQRRAGNRHILDWLADIPERNVRLFMIGFVIGIYDKPILKFLSYLLHYNQ